MSKDAVRTYYGETLGGTQDLKTSACCPATAPPARLATALEKIHPDVSARYYGCGLVVPDEDLTGLTIVDLGCGAGRDVYVLAQLVGADGLVIGIDMTRQQLDIARTHAQWHADRFDHARPNTRFLEGEIDRLAALDLPFGEVDLIVSNCVINLVPDKSAVFAGAAKLLRPGGRMVFSDIFTDTDIPAELARDPVILGECLGGAMTLDAFDQFRRAAGFDQPVWSEVTLLEIEDQEIAARLAGHRFESRTVELTRLQAAS